MAFEVGWLEGELLAGEEFLDTFATHLLALWAVTLVLVVSRLGVGGDYTLVVAEDDTARSLGDYIVRHDRSLATTARSVDYEGRDAVARGVATESLYYLDTLGDRGAEMLDTHREVALVDVVRAYTNLYETLDELLHHVSAVVDTTEENGLVAQWDTSVSKTGAGCSRLLGDLLWVVEVSVQPEWVILLEHVAELRGDALRANDRGT